MTSEIAPTEAVLYVLAQVAGGIAGVWAAHAMFELPVLQASLTGRTGSAQWFAEFVATFGLLAAIFGALRWRPQAVCYAVGLYMASPEMLARGEELRREYLTNFARCKLSGVWSGYAGEFQTIDLPAWA